MIIPYVPASPHPITIVRLCRQVTLIVRVVGLAVVVNIMIQSISIEGRCLGLRIIVTVDDGKMIQSEPLLSTAVRLESECQSVVAVFHTDGLAATTPVTADGDTSTASRGEDEATPADRRQATAGAILVNTACQVTTVH